MTFTLNKYHDKEVLAETTRLVAKAAYLTAELSLTSTKLNNIV